MIEIVKKISKNAIVLTLMVSCFSCSKEDEPVELAKVEVATFDKGRLIIKLLDNPNRIDSVMYSNTTLGNSSKLDKTLLVYDSGNNIALLSLPFESGHIGDEVQCCFYTNSSIEVGVSFEDLRSTVGINYLDSIPTINTGNVSPSCFYGTY